MTKFFPTRVDSTLGLMQQIYLAVGDRYVNEEITPDRFKLGEGVRHVDLGVERFRDGEVYEAGAIRLVAAGYILENTGELAAFVRDNPEEVRKYSAIVALGERSRWAHQGKFIYTPYAFMRDTYHGFNLCWLHSTTGSHYGALVSRR